MDIPRRLLEPLRRLGAVHFSVAINLVSDRELRVYCDYPAIWQDRYFRDAMYLKDPVFLSAPYLKETMTWDALGDAFPSRIVIDQAREFGLDHGVSIPVRIEDDVSMISITLDGTPQPTRSHRDALLREARQLVVALVDRNGDSVSRMESLAYLLASHGLQPNDIAKRLQDRRRDEARRAMVYQAPAWQH